MTIAVIGWGSLLTNIGALKIELNKWYIDGPFIPIEFARISKDKRLTLVVYPPGKALRTYYAISCFAKLDDAIADLAIREATPARPENIGFLDYNMEEIRSKKISQKLKEELLNWNKNKKFDAVIWTDLDENFQSAISKSFSLNNSIEHLKGLNPTQFAAAKEYILNAPLQTQTDNREGLTKFLHS